MTRKGKPRPSEKKLETKVADVEIIEITDPKKLPLRYLGVADGWEKRVDYWNERLRVRNVAIKMPYTLYKLTRTSTSKMEQCLELVSLEAPPPEGVTTVKLVRELKKPKQEETKDEQVDGHE